MVQVFELQPGEDTGVCLGAMSGSAASEHLLLEGARTSPPRSIPPPPFLPDYTRTVRFFCGRDCTTVSAADLEIGMARRSDLASNMVAALRRTSDPGALLVALSDVLEVSPDDPALSADQVEALAADDRTVLPQALRSSKNPEVIRLAFAYPTVANLTAVLANSDLSSEDFERVCAAYDSHPRRSLVSPIVSRAADSRWDITADLDTADVCDWLEEMSAQEQSTYATALASSAPKTFTTLSALVADRLISSAGRPFHLRRVPHRVLSEGGFETLDRACQLQVLGVYASSGREFVVWPAPLADWLRAADAPLALFSSVWAKQMTLSDLPAASGRQAMSPAAFALRRPASLPLQDAAAALAKIGRREGFSRFMIRVLEVAAGLAATASLATYKDRTLPTDARKLLLASGQVSLEYLESLGMAGLAESREPATPESTLTSLAMSRTYSPGDLEALAEVFESGGSDTLFDSAPAEVVLAAAATDVCLRHTSHDHGRHLHNLPAEVLAADDMMLSNRASAYLVSRLGEDPDRWRRFLEFTDRAGLSAAETFVMVQASFDD